MQGARCGESLEVGRVPIGPWPIRSLALSLPGPFAPQLVHSLELSLHWTFFLWNFRSHNVYLTVYWTKWDHRPTLCSVCELSLSSFCSYFHVSAVGLHVKTCINNKHSNENRKMYRLLEWRLYHIWQYLIAQFHINNNISLEYRHSMEYSQGEWEGSMSWT